MTVLSFQESPVSDSLLYRSYLYASRATTTAGRLEITMVRTAAIAAKNMTAAVNETMSLSMPNTATTGETPGIDPPVTEACARGH